jgi:anti-sigma factor RsiW
MKDNEFGINNEQELALGLKSFYYTKSLPAARVDFLLQAKNRSAQSNQQWRITPLMQIATLTAAIVIFFLVAAREEHRKSIERAVCAEVVMNHLKHSPLEVISSHYSEVQSALSRLDFSIMPANSMLLETYQLMGGRYCSIQGVPAAQLRVRDVRSAKECTLYAVKAAGKLRDVIASVESMDGIRVEIWRQDNVLFALAERKGDPDPANGPGY